MLRMGERLTGRVLGGSEGGESVVGGVVGREVGWGKEGL